jgi:hypothetical protein
MSNYNDTILYPFATELANLLGVSTRFYESYESGFNVWPLHNISGHVIGYEVYQAIVCYEGTSMPEVVKKYYPEEPYNEETGELWDSYSDIAIIGFRVLAPKWDTPEAEHEEVVRVIPFVDYREYCPEAYAEGNAKHLTLEEIKRDPDRYVDTLESMLAQL